MASAAMHGKLDPEFRSFPFLRDQADGAPMRIASSRLIASPSPAPRCLRASLVSSWANFWKRISCLSFGIPGPLSITLTLALPSCSVVRICTI